MNLPEIKYPKDTKDRVRNLLVQEARRTPKRSRKWLALPVVIAVAGTALAGTTAAGVYTAIAPVNDKRDIRCYYRADLTTTYPVKADPKVIMPPYLSTGMMMAGFDAKNNPNPGDPNAGMQQITDPINQCGRLWDMGSMNPQGITDDLIPHDFVKTKPTADPGKSNANGMPSDKYGNPIGGPAGPNKLIGHYVPQLTACVVDNSVAVIPGGPEICAHLGIPSLEK
ncbi:hypothetical protein [Arthrobacter sp. 135MFCol5.1]|uniref:hypothetical protein n=1 Tax=Arthrobacter sp. 135MFCol5.1 TaxID=1158050 RepID=UPI00036CB32F|nr:hypothetical protein [Arthrobacter sp. 135MFCol5.1]